MRNCKPEGSIAFAGSGANDRLPCSPPYPDPATFHSLMVFRAAFGNIGPAMHSPVRLPIPVQTLLLAYRSGIFPMADKRSDQDVFWIEPRERAVIPLDGLHVSRSLRKVLRSDRFTVTFDAAFERVIRACAAPRADHPESWISDRIVASYAGLHRAGHAHSIECWIDAPDEANWRDSKHRAFRAAAPFSTGKKLVGGLYGVSFDGVFCGESMFSLQPDASKVALCWLVALLRAARYRVLDCQFMTDHLASMGAVEIPQADYLARLGEARSLPAGARGGSGLHQAWRALIGDADHSSSPGKLIAQSLTQTS